MAMGSGFNCDLDIIRYFHQISNYVLYLYISLTEDGRWDST